MRRPKYLTGLAAALLLALGAGADEKAAEKPAHDHHAAAYLDCAKACGDCQRECDSCAHHCAMRVADGKKEHMKTLGTCTDCAEICSTAAHIAARQGPMAVTICEACAKSCDACGEACGAFKDDDHMKKCSESCKACAKACRDMIQHVGAAK
jgi:hypothetical protein